MLVPRRKIGPITAALEKRGYVVARHTGMCRVYPAGATPGDTDAIADLVEREANPTLRAAARAAQPATVLEHDVSIVPRGALVALKFQAAISQTRALGDRYQDVADLDRVVRARFDRNDEALALRIADTIYPGARVELAQMIDDLRNNRPVKI
jgi:hypothetical protein